MGQKVSFGFSFPVLLKEMSMRGQSNPFPFFTLSGTPTISEVLEEVFEVNANEGIKDMDLCEFI